VNEPIVAFIFKIINFFVFIGLGVYLFRKYVRQKIITSIAQKESFIRGLFDRQQELEQQQYALDQAVSKEEQLCLQLKKKVDLWKHLAEKGFKKKQQQKKEQVAFIYTRLKERTEMALIARIEKKAFQRAIEQSRAILKKQFSQNKNADQFLSRTISWISKNTQ